MADLQEDGTEDYPLLPVDDEVGSTFKLQINNTSSSSTDSACSNSEDSGAAEGDDVSSGDNDISPANSDISRSPNRLVGFMRKSWILWESYMLLKLAIPLCVMNAFTQLPFFVTLLFVGHFSDKMELDATLLGNTFLNITGTSLLVGMATAADTLCPQSYGYKNYKRVGVILQRGLLILSVACVPVTVVWLNSESLLLLVQQDPCVVSLTGRYASIFILALPGMLSYFMLSKYLQAQSLVVVFTVIGLASNVCLVVFCAVLVTGLHLGSVGASMALVISNLLNPILLFVYIRCCKLHNQTWGGWSFECLTEWWQFIRLGVPGVLTLAFAWWSFEISTLVAGSISTTQLTISSTILQLCAIYYMAPLGMAQAVTVRVGNELGAGDITSAKRSSFVALGLQTIFAIVLSVVTISCRNYVGYLFISDPEVVAGVGDTLTTAIGIIFLDQIEGVISGLMRATGRQAILAIINFCCYYLVGLPLGITLAMVVNMKSKGIWLGLSVGGFIQTTLLLVLLFKMNWRKENEKAVKNASSSIEYTEVVTTDVKSDKTRSISVVSHDSGIEGEPDQTEVMEMQDLDSSNEVKGDDNCKPSVTLVRFMRNTGRRRSTLASLPEYEETNGDLLSSENRRNSFQDIEEVVSGERRESGIDMSCDDTSRLLLLACNEEQDKAQKDSMVLEDSYPPPSKRLYKSSTRFCQTKFSILLTKGMILLVCVVLLVGGAVLAATIQHHPEGCGQLQNCSQVCLNSSLEDGSALGVSSLSSSEQLTFTPSVARTLPHPLTVQYNDDETVSDCLCEIMPTPSPLLS